MNITDLILALFIAVTASAYTCDKSEYFLSAYIDGCYHPLEEGITNGKKGFVTILGFGGPAILVKDESKSHLRFKETNTLVGITDDNNISGLPNIKPISFDFGSNPGRVESSKTFYAFKDKEQPGDLWVIKSDYSWHEYFLKSKVNLYVHNMCDPGPNMCTD